MRYLLLLLTQARQCAALHRALAASRALDNCPPIATRHRPTAPQHLHLHARGNQRRRPTCSCAGQCASNRPAVRHVEDDATLEAVDEDPRGPRLGKTGAVGAGARPRRRRSCCSAAAAPTRAQVRPPPRRRGDAVQRRRRVDGVGFSRFGPASPVHMRLAGAHSTADTGCGRCETSVARICGVTTKVTAGGGSPPRNRFASRRARGGHVVSTRRRCHGHHDDVGAIFAVAQEIGTSIFLANKGLERRQASAAPPRSAPVAPSRRVGGTGERRRWRRDGGMGTHARAAGAGRGGAHSTSSTSALDRGRAASSNFAFDVAVGACVLLLRDVPQRAAKASFTPARRPLRSSWIARGGHLKLADPTHGRARPHTRALSSRPMAWEAFGSSCRRPELVRRARQGLGACPRRARLERAAATRRPAHRNDRVDDASRGAGTNDPEGRGEPAPSPRRATPAPRPTAQRVRQARHRRRELRWPRRPPLRRRRRPPLDGMSKLRRGWRVAPESCKRPAVVALPVSCVV
ncbi:unnamed protein product [Pelagomonas calceolata]|uniref:Uncharacterized protein n=2 Tax=Pelagomonas calceolata TaxID=35677 RepID=A0A8J2WYI1_9STRA|nr:unnamed protein product [Pelagomonas calceolata]